MLRRAPYVRFLNTADDDMQMSLLSVRPHPYPPLAVDDRRTQGQRQNHGQRQRQRQGQNNREDERGHENVVYERESMV